MATVEGRTEVQGKEVQDNSTFSEQNSGPGSHVNYQVEVESAGGYDADEEQGPTMRQKLKEKISDAENYMKGKESSDKVDPHPELAYVPPGDGQAEATGDLQEGKIHGGTPVAALGNDAIHTDETKNYPSNVGDNSEGVHKEYSGEGADAPTIMEKIKEKTRIAENRMKGKEPSEIEDPHPELAYVTPSPQENKPGFLSKVKDTFAGQEKEGKDTLNPATVPLESDKGVDPASEVQKPDTGVGSSEVGTGYEEDGEETINPAAVPLKADEGVEPPPEVHKAVEVIGSGEMGTGYDEGKDGSFSDTKLSGFKKTSPEDAQWEEKTEVDTPSNLGEVHSDAKAYGTVEHTVSRNTQESVNRTSTGDEKHKKPGFFSRLAKKVGVKKSDP